jgi:hypothetical protein
MSLLAHLIGRFHLELFRLPLRLMAPPLAKLYGSEVSAEVGRFNRHC